MLATLVIKFDSQNVRNQSFPYWNDGIAPGGELCVYFRPVTSTATTVDSLLHQQAAPYRPLQLHKTVSAYLRICAPCMNAYQLMQDHRC